MAVVFKYILRAPYDRAVRYLKAGVVEHEGPQGLRVRDGNGVVLQRAFRHPDSKLVYRRPDGESIDGDMIPGDFERLCKAMRGLGVAAMIEAQCATSKQGGTSKLRNSGGEAHQTRSGSSSGRAVCDGDPDCRNDTGF
jgi:hypothetical protein